MQCQLCKKNSAAIKIAQVINNKTVQINLCKKCAEQKGIDNPLVALPQVFGNFLNELLGSKEVFDANYTKGPVCEGCGLSWEAFQDTGLFGCDICYRTFENELNVVLRRIHGSNHHIGSRPKSQRKFVDEQELKRIKVELESAINNEDFELAAELRDVIKDAQRGNEQKENDGILR